MPRRPASQITALGLPNPDTFFATSSRMLARVTHTIVYPAGSKLLVAMATAAHVLPDPGLCHNKIPLVFIDGFT